MTAVPFKQPSAWIPVEHRMPKPFEPVLVAYRCGMQRVMYALRDQETGFIRWVDSLLGHNGNWSGKRNHNRQLDITHWMPLSKGPNA